ncbi:hypothetical protein DFH27DRAFT_397985 [Peziza echinospora]|nr:hypothetical protein DFH27DRAFT_397985 [Peziza echinospora]
MPEYEEMRRLRSEVSALRDLLQNLQATQLQQSQAIIAYLGTVGEDLITDASATGRSRSLNSSGITRYGSQRVVAPGSAVNFGGVGSHLNPQIPRSSSLRAAATPVSSIDNNITTTTNLAEAPELAGQEQVIKRSITLRRRPAPSPSRVAVPALPESSLHGKDPVTPRSSRNTEPAEVQTSDNLKPKVPSRQRSKNQSLPASHGRSRPSTPITSEIDNEAQMWISWGGGQFSEESLKEELAEAQRRNFSAAVGSQRDAFAKLVESNYFSQIPTEIAPGEHDYYELSRYMNCAGAYNPQVDVWVRDFYSMRCDKVIKYIIEGDRGLWDYLARARSIGGIKVADNDEEILESYQKVDGCVGSIEGSGDGVFPAFGREIVVEELTPNIALLMMTIVHHTSSAYIQPRVILDSVLTNAISQNPSTRFSYDVCFPTIN